MIAKDKAASFHPNTARNLPIPTTKLSAKSTPSGNETALPQHYDLFRLLISLPFLKKQIY